MQAALIASLAASAVAAPLVSRRQAAAPPAGVTDATILNYALSLEHLEATFYREALAKFSDEDFKAAGLGADFVDNLKEIAKDEATHVDFLTAGLIKAGAVPAQECKYKFGYTDVQSFLATANLLEGVGVSAYLGAAGAITNKDYLTAAGSILTVEARHSAFIRYANTYSPFPAAFDTPQTPSAIITLAAPFFASCPNGALPNIAPHPFITVGNGTAQAGGQLSLSANTSSAQSGQQLYCAFASGLKPSFSQYSNGQCQIPGDIVPGQVYVAITNAQNLTDGATVAGPAAFQIDTANNTASSGNGAARSGSGNGSGNGGSGGNSGAASSLKATVAVGATGLVAGVFALLL